MTRPTRRGSRDTSATSWFEMREAPRPEGVGGACSTPAAGAPTARPRRGPAPDDIAGREEPAPGRLLWAYRELGGGDPGRDHLALAVLVDHLHPVTRLQRAELGCGVDVGLQADRALRRPHREHPRRLVDRDHRAGQLVR